MYRVSSSAWCTTILYVLCSASALCEAQSAHRWEFHGIDDREGWEVRPGARGVVMGSALWLTLSVDPLHSALNYELVGGRPSCGDR